MAADLVLSVQAEDDLTNAGDWYQGNRPAYVGRFLRAINARLRHIARSPRLGSVASPLGHRRATVPRYPYVIVYHFDGSANQVRVVAVWHTSRDPDDLRRRLSETDPEGTP